MLKRILRLGVVACLISGGALAQSPAPQNNMIRLGIVTTTPGAERDRISVGAASGRVSAIQIVAGDGPVLIDAVRIEYANGQTFEDSKPRKLNPRDRTKLIDDRLEQRSVDAIEVVYAAKGKPTKSVPLEIWGRQSPEPPSAPPETEIRSPDVTLIASATLSTLIDRDVIALTPPVAIEGKLQLRAVDKPLEILTITAVSIAGSTKTVLVNAKLAAGGTTPLLDVASDSIREIRITYRPAPGTPETVKLEVYVPSRVPRTVRSAEEDDRGYVEVPVYFGTDRLRDRDRDKDGRALAVFSNKGDPNLSLGESLVTIPTSKDRERGSIPRPEWNLYFVTFALRNEDLRRDFIIQTVNVLNEDAFVDRLRKRMADATKFKNQAFVFIHGYNNTFDDAIFRTAQIAHDVGFDGAACLYSWPSNAGVLGYAHDLKRVLGARQHLIKFLNLVRLRTGATQVHLIAHSMGNQLLMEVLQQDQAFPPAGGAKPFGEIILAAPDITRDNFQKSSGRLKDLAKGVTLYASSKDKALRISEDVSQGETPAGAITRSGKPIVVPGVESVDVSAVSTDFFAMNHSDFGDRKQLLQDIELILGTGTHPPKVRLPPAFDEIGPAGDMFWRYVVR